MENSENHGKQWYFPFWQNPLGLDRGFSQKCHVLTHRAGLKLSKLTVFKAGFAEKWQNNIKLRHFLRSVMDFVHFNTFLRFPTVSRSRMAVPQWCH